MEQVRPEERATCDAAHDHCLPPETWFMPMTWKEDTYGTARTGEWVAPGGGEWRPSVVSKGHRSSFRGYRTVPASDDNVAVGAIAVVFSATGCPPQNQAWATTNDWIIGHVAEVEAGGRRFRFEGAKKWLSTAAARVVVETRDHRNDPRP